MCRINRTSTGTHNTKKIYIRRNGILRKQNKDNKYGDVKKTAV